MSAISSQDIISILKEEIENYDFEAKDREIGHVIWVGDGIATVYGIDQAMYGEIVVWYRMSEEMRSVSFCLAVIQGSRKEPK